MQFNSFQFMIFLPIVLLVYYIIPQKKRYIWLLISSYYFYMCWNAIYIIHILFSTLITYFSALLMDIIRKKDISIGRQKLYLKGCVAGSFILNLSVLFYFKYFNFFIDNINYILKSIHISISIPQYDILLPVGISFYTFQALGYTMDVYREEIYAEKNFLRYALFVSFFPQLVAGPIERSKNLLKQLAVPKSFDFYQVKKAILIMIWGFFLKLVIADRIAIFVSAVYNDYELFGGYYIVVATILFAIQLYCDFYGYSTIAMGAAQLLGIQLMQNFDSPYLSGSVAEFWRRWHISLSGWFRDYLYIPLGGNRKGKFRKYLNIMIVFFVSGLWHGANWTYVIWGCLNGAYQIIGDLLKPIRNVMHKLFRLNPSTLSHRIMRVTVTFLLVDFTYLFFRANSIMDAFNMLKSVVTVSNPWILFDDSLYQCGLDGKNFRLLCIAIFILFFADICKYKKIEISEVILKQEYWFRWVAIVFSVCAILLFGIWGSSYDASNFIYFQF